MKGFKPCMETLLEIVIQVNNLSASDASDKILKIKKEIKGKKEGEVNNIIERELNLPPIYFRDIRNYNPNASYNKVLLPPKLEDLEKLTEQFLFS